MKSINEGGAEGPSGWIARAKQAFWPPPGPGRNSEDVLPSEERKAVMRSLDPLEVKASVGAFAFATLVGIGLPIYFLSQHSTTKHGRNSFTVGPDALLLGGLLLVLCIGGFVAIWHRKRTLVSFDLMLTGFGLTLPLTLLGFAYIVLGGWFMLRASRINRYGTTNTKAIRTQAAARPRGKDRKETAKTGTNPAVRKPPTASKRYTPKSPPRKKIPKPTE
jgi:hypothetical protein